MALKAAHCRYITPSRVCCESSGFVKHSFSSVTIVNTVQSSLDGVLPPRFFNRRPPCVSGVLPSPGTVAPVECVLPSASVLTFSCALEPDGGFCSSLQSEALAGQQSQTFGSSAVPPVCGGSVDLLVHPVSWRPEVVPPPSSSRVTSNLGVELPISILTTLSGLVVPSPSVAARDTPVLSSVYRPVHPSVT